MRSWPPEISVSYSDPWMARLANCVPARMMTWNYSTSEPSMTLDSSTRRDMKYKIGDKFVRDSDVASFDKLEIAYIWPEMDRYVLYIEDDGWRSEPYVVRDEGTLSSYYKEVEAFFEVGKTYKFKADGGAGIRHFTTSYTVRSVH